LAKFLFFLNANDRERESMQEKERNGLFGKLNGLKKEIYDLKISLNHLDGQKEEWFRKKESLSKEIKDKIKNIRENKTKRNSLTEEVKKHKEKRKEIYDKSKNKISDIKEIGKQERDLIRKHNIKGNPSRIKEDIDMLESKIETEVISFEKEKEIMKKIKALKKKLKETKELNVILNKKSDVSKEIDMLKNEAKDSHKKVQDKAKESQAKHEVIITNSAEIDELKKKEEKAFQKFIEFKKKFNEANDKLKDKLMGMNKVNEKLDIHKKEHRKRRKDKEQEILKGKGDIIKEKMKKGGKLTTEDLLIFQNSK